MTARACVAAGLVGSLVSGFLVGSPLAASAQSHASSHAAAPGQSASSKPPAPALPELETDRPDITESSSVVGPGLWQLETGVLFQSDRVNAITTHDVSVPNALLRVGVGSRLELRFSGEGFLAETLSTPGVASLTGGSDVELGLKYKLMDQERAGIDVAIIPIVSLPIGSDAFTTGALDPTIKLTLARDLPGRFSIGGNVIAASITESGERFTQTSVSASLGRDLAAGWGGFWEIYGASALTRDGNRAWLFDTGVTRALGGKMQIDISIGRGLSSDAPDWFIGAGFAVRGIFKH